MRRQVANYQRTAAKVDTYAREPLQQDPYSIQRKLLKQPFNLRMQDNLFLAFVGFPRSEKSGGGMLYVSPSRIITDSLYKGAPTILRVSILSPMSNHLLQHILF